MGRSHAHPRIWPVRAGVPRCRTHRGEMPDSPWRDAGLTVARCRTHRGEMPDSPWRDAVLTRRGRAALTRQSSGSSVTVSAALAPLDDFTVTFRLRRAVGRGGGG